jgi:hypothetical protein
MRFNPAYAIELPGVIFPAYWLFAALRVNQTEPTEPAGEHAARILVMFVAFLSAIRSLASSPGD